MNHLVSKESLLKLILENKTRKEIMNELQIKTHGSLRFYINKYGLQNYHIKENHSFTLQLEGQKFGLLTVISRSHIRKCDGAVIWNCKCDCGNEVQKKGYLLKRGCIQSCGCLRHKKGQYNKKNKGFGEISGSYIYGIQYRCQRLGMEYNVTTSYLWDIFLKQNRLCVFSHRLLTFVSDYRNHKDQQTASLDRINSNLGYIEGNIQWVHKDINKMKLTFNNEEFYAICAEIVDNYHDRNK